MRLDFCDLKSLNFYGNLISQIDSFRIILEIFQTNLQSTKLAESANFKSPKKITPKK